MTSTFVSKAALIARRKLEQKPKSERKEKKAPVKEPKKPVPDKPNEDPEEGKKVSCLPHTNVFKPPKWISQWYMD